VCLFRPSWTRQHRATLDTALARAAELDIKHIVVATTTGETPIKLLEKRGEEGPSVVAVTHSAGFAGPNTQELLPEHREAIIQGGGHILTCQHALGGVNRAVRRKLGTYQLDEIIAFTLRSFGQGMKVACEITVMAADAGLIPAGEEIIAIGGSGRGADTAAVILSANAQDFFDLRVLEILCKPRAWR
jgi:uncharacterized protein